MNRALSLKLSRYAPTALSIIGSAGVVCVTIFTAVKSKEVALRVNELEKTKGEKLTTKEVIKTAAPSYIPIIALDVATIACILGANVLNRQQQAALMSAYALTERAYSRYRNKVKEICGEDVHKKVMDELSAMDAKKQYISSPGMVSASSLEFDDENEEKHLFYDEFSMRYFNATFSQVLQAEYHINRNFAISCGENYVNEFYKFLGIDTVPEYQGYGWFVADDFYWIDFTHTKTIMDDGLEVYIIRMEQTPCTYEMFEKIYE